MAIKASATIMLASIRDLQSCTRYYLLQSSTSAKPSKPTANPPGGSWVTAEPSYTSGSTNSLYFCDLNVFTDGDYAYSDVSLSSSYEAAKAAYNKAVTAQDSIDSLEVGGRNILIDTNAPTLTKVAATGNRYFSDASVSAVVPSMIELTDAPVNVSYGARFVVASGTGANTHRNLCWYSSPNVVPMADGQEYTASVYARITSGETMVVAFQYGAASYVSKRITTTETGWRRYSWTFTYTTASSGDTTGTGARFYIGCGSRYTGTLEMCGFKLEKGGKATDWTPAPEDVSFAIDTAQSTAEQALSSTECIVGTQTASTNAWTGIASFSSLVDGQTILYWLPYAGTSTAATLNLTLSGGGTTGAKNVYINSTTRCTTHIAAGNMVQMVYRVGVSISGTAYTGWWISRALNDNTYDRIRFNNVIKAKTAITASRVIVGDSSGFFHLVAGSTFDVDKPILWAGSAISAAATGNNNYLSFPSCTLRNNAGSSWTATQYQTLYLAGTLSGSSFVVASSDWLTTSPASEALTYIALGYMYSTYQMYFYPEHPMYRLIDGELIAVSQLAYEAQVAATTAQATADAARADFKRVVRIDDDGLHVGDNLSNGEVLVDSESVNVVLGGIKYSKFAGSYVQFGNYQLRRSSDGGLVFKLA